MRSVDLGDITRQVERMRADVAALQPRLRRLARRAVVDRGGQDMILAAELAQLHEQAAQLRATMRGIEARLWKGADYRDLDVIALAFTIALACSWPLDEAFRRAWSVDARIAQKTPRRKR